MKKRTSFMITAGCLIALGLTGCQGNKSEAESAWNSVKSGRLTSYVEKNKDKLDMEKLKAEAGSADSSLDQQFQATALLCALEYENSLGAPASQEADSSQTENAETKAALNSFNAADLLYQFDYPVSASYADQFLAKVNTNGDQFWEALKNNAVPSDCFDLLLAAADKLDGKTLVSLIKNVPSDSSYAKDLKSSIDTWIEKRPAGVINVGDSLIETDYYSDWRLDQYISAYFQPYTAVTPVRTKNADEAIQYASYLSTSILPYMETKFGKEELQQQFDRQSSLSGETYLSTRLDVIVDEPLTLKKAEESSQPDTIDLSGKKVAAFYRNTQAEQFKGSPVPLLLFGDFMLNLPKEELPGSAQDTDYYLVLTPNYQYGEFYMDNAGKPMDVQEVYSSTSIDLYDAKTGDLLRHLGNVMEQPDSRIMVKSDQDTPQYPELPAADKLLFIYHNINNPAAYSTLLDHTSNLPKELSPGTAVTLGTWEVTLQSNTITKSFQEGDYSYEAGSGSQYVRANLTIKNVGSKPASFFSTKGLTDDNTIVRITDSSHKDFYLCSAAPNDTKCLNDAFLKPGESKDGELIFEVPDQVLQKSDPLYFEVSLNNQKVYYPLTK